MELCQQKELKDVKLNLPSVCEHEQFNEPIFPKRISIVNDNAPTEIRNIVPINSITTRFDEPWVSRWPCAIGPHSPLRLVLSFSCIPWSFLCDKLTVVSCRSFSSEMLESMYSGPWNAGFTTIFPPGFIFEIRSTTFVGFAPARFVSGATEFELQFMKAAGWYLHLSASTKCLRFSLLCGRYCKYKPRL